MNATEAREQRAKALARRREDERLCALDFLTWGDQHGSHAKRCVHADTSTPTCSFDYNPGPVPDDEKLYQGTALGALWSQPSTSEGAVALLAALRAGWNITRRKDAA